MSPGEWIAGIIGLLTGIGWLSWLTYRIGRRDQELSKAQADVNGVGRKVRGTLGLLIVWEDLEPKERRKRASDLQEGK